MKKIIYLLIIFTFFSGWSFAQPSLLVMTEDLPPFNFSDHGEVVGISTEIVRHIFKQAGVSMDPEDIQLYPWTRAYHKIQNSPGTALFSMARTEKRENLFCWVGPLLDVTIGIIAKKNDHITINSIADLERYRIGSVRDGAPEQLLIKRGVPQKSLERLAFPEPNIKKLQAGRIDLFVFNVQTTRYLMLRLGINPDEYETVFVLKNLELYLALHRQTDHQLVQSLQKSLDKMKIPDADGLSLFDRIVGKYLFVPDKNGDRI
ncbi:transporter substrate-binding domain-containing protein [uncultured Desulfuromusa sp.]|uniref:substrate-binding periplasmic protein n=1 Tax=uncultured Desulfuromusa sp. TaxID=219183 RepID=UPI002AA6DBA5|nr:transporter substrate-binding domain-containing protein [uncultured Desulfuromusa sp.]